MKEAIDISNNINNYQALDAETFENQSKQFSHIISIISWVIFDCTLFEYYLNKRLIGNKLIYPYFSLLDLFILVNSLLGLISYLIFTTCKRRKILYNIMLSKVVKTHSVPLFLLSLMLIIEQFVNKNHNTKRFRVEDFLSGLISIHFLLCLPSLCFTFIVVLSLSKKQYSLKWYIVLPIKKGTFSCLIPYLLYKFTYDSFLILLIMQADRDTIAFVFIVSFISIGVVSLFYSFKLKDIIMALTNILISIGLIINLYLYEILRELYYESAITFSIIVAVINVFGSFSIIIFLLLNKSEDLLK